MKLIRPFTVTAASLTSSVAETDATEYASTATYAAGATAMWTVGADATHHVYESVVDGNVGNALTDAAKWLDLGPTNRFAMFDQKNGTSTTAASIDVSVDVTGRADGLALLNLTGEQVYISMEVDGTARTNLATYSEDFSNAIWFKFSAGVTANAGTAPNGTTTADFIKPSGVTTSQGLSYNSAFGAGTFSFSVYAKAGGYPRLGIRVDDGAVYAIKSTFDLSLGTVVSSVAGTATITDVGGGWYRCTATGSNPAGNFGAVVGWVIEPLPAGALCQDAYTADGVSGTYLWGAQIEASGAASSYLPNTTAAVTSTTQTVYERTYSLQQDDAITSWYAYFTEEIVYQTDLVLTDLPLYTNPVVRVVITGIDTVSCGSMVLGQTRELGAAVYGAQAGIIDYSKKETDDFGNYTIVERAFAKRNTFKLVVANTEIDSLYTMLAAYRVTPAVWIGADDYACTWIFGFYRSFGVEIAQIEKSYLTLEIEGLT